MTFLKSAALLAAIGIGLINVAAPGLAAQPDRTPLAPVTIAPLPPLPAVTQQAVAEAQQAATGSREALPATAQDDSGYATLSAAIDAQSVSDDMSDELRCLAGAVYFESKGEPLSGQLAVADVIINRTKSGRFPSSICSVVKQPGQFSFIRHGDLPDIRNGRAYRTAIAVAKVAMADAWDSPAGDALYFHANYVKPGWGKTRVASIGHHVFFR